MENLNIKRPLKKLTEKRIGPYPIVEIKSSNAVQLKLPWLIKIHPVINVSHIHLYRQSHIPQQTAPEPPPVEIEGEFKYKVEQILDSWLYRGNLQYLVKWLGYTKEHNTWEPASNLINSKEAVDKFHWAHPSAPPHIRSLSPFRFRPIENYMETPEGLWSALNCDRDWIDPNKNHHEWPLHQHHYPPHIFYHSHDVLDRIHTRIVVACS
jgi:Chromo (CHRromatin Organisation MOdifier) domain